MDNNATSTNKTAGTGTGGASQFGTGTRYAFQKRLAIIALALLIFATIVFIMVNSCMDPDASWEFSNATGGLFSPILHAVHNAAVALFGWTGNEYILEYGAFVRKTAHFLEYAALGAECSALSVLLRGKIFGSLTWMATFVPLFVAVIDEFVQGFVGRTSSVSDVLLDFCGACCGIAFAMIIAAIVKRIAHRRKQ